MSETDLSGPAVFWNDLDRYLDDPMFRDAYVEELLRIQTFDEQARANDDQPLPAAVLEQRLERAESSPSGAILMGYDEAQALLEEIQRLQANQAHWFERYQPLEVERSLGFNLGGVTLRTQITVNGRRLSMYAQADEYAWVEHGPEFQEYLKTELRRRLIEEIVANLEPQVTVERYRQWNGGLATLNPFVTLPARSGLGP